MTDWKRVRDEAGEKYTVGTERADGHESSYGRTSISVAFKEGYDYAIENDPRVKNLKATAVKLGLMKDAYNPDYIPSIRDLIDAEEEFKEALKAFEGSGE